MKKFSAINIIFFACILFLSGTSLSWGDDDLTNEEKLACESILCLSSGDRPSECNPSLNKFFGIDDKDDRKKFLKKCPDSDADGMPELIDTLVDYNCSACTVEKLNKRYVEVRLTTARRRSIKDSSYAYTTIRAVDPEMPSYCGKYYAALRGNEYTAYSTYAEYEPVYGDYALGSRYEDYEGSAYYIVNTRGMSSQERQQAIIAIQNNHWEWFE
jgi:hypothetical protein